TLTPFLTWSCMFSLSRGPRSCPYQEALEDSMMPSSDPSSFSCPEECRATSLNLVLDVDFQSHVLKGTIDITVKKQNTSCNSVVLDTKDLKIHKITNKATGQELNYTLAEPVAVFGSKLEVTLPVDFETGGTVSIQYETSPQCSALQWLKPEQTAGKRHPYLFSQCQPIHARSLLPCQDTPAVKCKYTAKIRAPKEIVILMSAVRLGAESCPENPARMVHSFKQDVPIPSYLIAIVGGDLESRDIGPRSKVWSEKELVEQAEYEFAETEQMIQTAESLLGPYVWGQYDLLVLPPSFPFGGMENPCLTFVTPTLLAGDRSLADVVAHEISHSWTGNLVTNNSFEHFWLNEGHTVFVERKIDARLKNGEPFRQFMAEGGWNDLQYAVSVLGAEHPYTRLVPDLKGIDPDDAFSIVPYEKGFALLFYLENLLGGPEVFEPFLRAYIEKFKYQSLDTNTWKDFLYSYFHSEIDKLNTVDWETWFRGVGMPPVHPSYDDSMAQVCEGLAERWSSAPEEDLSQFTSEDLRLLLSVQVRDFLVRLNNKPVLSLNKVKKMEEMYGFNRIHNAEIRYQWLRLGIKTQWEDIIPSALQFVTEQGRLKFTRPIYRDLYNWEKSRDAAIANFLAHRAQMHNTTASMVAKELKLA
ncbi:hypothetical protein ACJMK2_018086, partial [Sinanodonta woodiana]